MKNRVPPRGVWAPMWSEVGCGGSKKRSIRGWLLAPFWEPNGVKMETKIASKFRVDFEMHFDPKKGPKEGPNDPKWSENEAKVGPKRR